MARCPRCSKEYSPVPGQGFCDGCGQRLNDLPAPDASGPAAVEEPQVTLAAHGDIAGDLELAAEVPTNEAGEGSGPSKVIAIDSTGNIAGRDLTIVQQPPKREFCAAGREHLPGGRPIYQCDECDREPVCDRHFDEVRRICTVCAEGPQVVCTLCNLRIPSSETFTCQKCRRIVGKDHRDPQREVWCTACRDDWNGVVEAIEREEVGISMDGTVVGRDDVKLQGKVLTTKDGKAVATIKDTTWYAVPKQWYRIKPKLLQQEQQAMSRFYPTFEMGTTEEGDRFWQGEVTTWTRNEYEIHLRYPAAFPYKPPNVFVVNPKIKQSRHIYPDGHLCLFHKDDKAWENTTTAATVMSWTSLWLHCYETWLETGNWPRPEHDVLVITTDY